MTQGMVKLRIDPEFQNLISALSQEEYELLEQNIIRDGCREPISVWNDVILDGHNRYRICMQHNIQFAIVQIRMTSRQDAIAWICSNQLGRRNISDETRKYLIGKRYDAEKKKATEQNLYRGINPPVAKMLPPGSPAKGVPRTSLILGKEYHVSHTTIQKYGQYAKAIDKLADRNHLIVPKILSGKVKVSQDKIIELAQLPKDAIHDICQQIDAASTDSLPYSQTRRIINIPKHEKQKTIKDMPDYDPDAEVSILTLTIPSWKEVINRVVAALSIHPVSGKARSKLKCELLALSHSLVELMKAISEVQNGNQ